ncbi:unnamed protein product [Triticum turgidum subsp. durum]|nr:unnamed protein product [Triticum turgidum subsp. durum]
MEVWILGLVVCECLSLANKVELRFGSCLGGCSTLPWGHAGGEKAEARMIPGSGSFGGFPQPDPWRSLGPSGFVPTSPPFSCCNKFQYGAPDALLPRSVLTTMVVGREIEQQEMYMPTTCRRPRCYLPPLDAAKVVDEEGWGSTELKIDGRVRAHQQRILWWSYGACSRLPVFIDPLLLLVEGRPTPFLLACMPYGRQFQFSFRGYGMHVLHPWRSRRPKWFVPGDGEVQSEQRLPRTRLRFNLSARGSPCKSLGLCCNLSFSFGPDVKCALKLI